MNNELEQVNRHATTRLLRVTQVLGILTTTFLFGAHVFKWVAVQVDGVTLALLGLLLVIPHLELIRKIKFGEFEAEIGRAEVEKVQAKAATDLPPTLIGAISNSEARVIALLDEDPRLALAKVRIDIEEALKQLYATGPDAEPDWKRLSLGRLVDNLVKREVLSPSVASALRDVIALANRAVHGERVDPDAAKQLAVLGTRLVYEVQQLCAGRSLNPIEKVVISREEVERYLTPQYKVATVVPLDKNPTKNTYILDQNALKEFLAGYEQYAEFVVSIERI